MSAPAPASRHAPGAATGPAPAYPPPPPPLPPPPAPVAPPRGRRRAERDLVDGLVGGVAAGLARHTGLPALGLRVGFVLATALSGLGVVLYAGFWLVLPAATAHEVEAPGLASATRGGRRPGRRRRLSDTGPVLALSALAIGALFVVEALLGRGTVLWPLALGLAGLALLWRQADEAQRERWVDATGRIDPATVLLGDRGWASWARLAAGLALVVLAAAVFALRSGSLGVARDVGLAVVLGVLGIALVVGPLLLRLVRELGAERAERVRTQERADVAAHLHDSVLQTLALIQQSASDASTVARLARAQERDLRSWLFEGDDARDTTALAGGLRAAAAEVDDAWGVAVDVVTVGDLRAGGEGVDDGSAAAVRALVGAAREAMTNAAKHAGVDRVDVYAEVTPTAVEVFVRDRGRGFDPSGVPEHRQGLRGSIVDRTERHGGTAEVRSAPGEGTEVRLRLDRTRARTAHPEQTHPEQTYPVHTQEERRG